MKVYSYDYTGRYIGETKAELCQLTELRKKKQKKSEPEIESVFIVPSYSTLTPPPELKENQEAIFVKDEWTVIDVVEEKEEEKKPEPELTYAQKRASSYPNVYDYIDGVVKNDKAQMKKYVDECLAVKAKYPKPVGMK